MLHLLLMRLAQKKIYVKGNKSIKNIMRFILVSIFKYLREQSV